MIVALGFLVLQQVSHPEAQPRSALSVLELVPVIVNAAVAELPDRARPRRDNDTILINIESFAVQLSMFSGKDVQAQEISKRVDVPHRVSSPGTLLQCSAPQSGVANCQLNGGSLYTELNYLMRTDHGIEAVFTTKWTNFHGPDLASVGMVVIRGRFEPRNGVWQLVYKETILLT
ncbi:MAG: hypothetical protein ACREJ4_04450 [Candidatus Methylomirabilaceae bacterium]